MDYENIKVELGNVLEPTQYLVVPDEVAQQPITEQEKELLQRCNAVYGYTLDSVYDTLHNLPLTEEEENFYIRCAVVLAKQDYVQSHRTVQRPSDTQRPGRVEKNREKKSRTVRTK
jgi:hypothetical protein